jgi:hypothetical protein
VLTVGGRFLGDCWFEDDRWNIAISGGLVGVLERQVSASGSVLVRLAEASGAVVATFTPAGTAVLVKDASEATFAVLRRDGAGGTNVTGAGGAALMFAGRSTSSSCLEVLITDAGAAQPLITLFGLLAATELAVEAPNQTEGSPAPSEAQARQGEDSESEDERGY